MAGDIEKILTGDPHVKIMPTKKRPLEEINYDFIRPEQREAVRTKTIPLLREFLETPYFADDFTDHVKRTVYLKELERIHGKELFTYYKLNNGLGFTKITHAIMILDRLVNQDYNGPHKTELEVIMNSFCDLTDYNQMLRTYARYQTLSNEEKIKLVEGKKDIVARALQILARKK